MSLDTVFERSKTDFNARHLNPKDRYWVDAPACECHGEVLQIREKRNRKSEGALLGRIEYANDGGKAGGDIIVSIFDGPLRDELVSYAENWRKESGSSARVFDLKAVEDSHEPWTRIRDDPILDELFSVYMEYAKNAVPEQFQLVEKAKEGRSLHEIGIIFHEKREVLEYLKLGYGREELANGKAHGEAYDKAHDQALLAQYTFIQHASKALGGCPFMALVMACPVGEALGEQYNPESNILQFDNWKSILDTEVAEKDIEKAMKLYEIGGYTYKDRESAKKAAIECIEEVKKWSTSPSA